MRNPLILWSTAWLAAATWWAATIFSNGPPGSVEVRILEAAQDYTYRPGLELRVRVELASDSVETVFAQWVQADGSPLTARASLACNREHTLTIDAPERGYYGVLFSSDDPRVAFPPEPAGFASREFGFAVLPEPAPRALEPASPFGMVHGARADPYLVGHIKTLTWNTTGARWWKREMDERRDAGLLELPIVAGRGWDSDDDAPIPAAQLDALGERFEEYLGADPQTEAWELGIEENAGDTYFSKAFYFANLKAKAGRIRALADARHPALRLVYNTRGFDYEEIEALFACGAMESFQVFSSHPYRWKNFESPETWLAEHVRELRDALARHDLAERELWFTEVGIPVRGTRDPAAFFGYPKHERSVPGATRDYAAQYMVKLHVIALAEGVERIYWYNYQNRGDDIHYAEDHFGLRAFTADGSLGHPLPSYVAYVTMVQALARKTCVRSDRALAPLWIFEFRGPASRRTLVAWTHPDEERAVPWSALRDKLEPEQVTGVFDVYGTPRAYGAAGLTLSPKPVYIEFGE